MSNIKKELKKLLPTYTTNFILKEQPVYGGSNCTIIGGTNCNIQGNNVLMINCHNITETRDNALWINNIDLTETKNAELIAKALMLWLEERLDTPEKKNTPYGFIEPYTMDFLPFSQDPKFQF